MPEPRTRAGVGARTSPRLSAFLRGFVVYLVMIGGVMVLSDNPVAPGQGQYVKLAGLMSLVAFLVSYRPTLFGRVLSRAYAVVDPDTKATRAAEPRPADQPK